MFRWLFVALALWTTAPTPAFAEDAPAFSLRDINNQEVSLESFDGQVVLLSFWATWCGPCKVEMPHLQRLHTELGERGFSVLSVSADDARTASQVKPYIRRQGYDFPVVLDKQSAVTALYNPTKTLPYTAIIDRSGSIAYKHSGYNPGDEEEIRAKVLELLAQPAPTTPAEPAAP